MMKTYNKKASFLLALVTDQYYNIRKSGLTTANPIGNVKLLSTGPQRRGETPWKLLISGSAR